MVRLQNCQLTRPIIFFDLEATGTNPQVDRIVEICVAKLMPGGESEVKSRRINPGRPIPAEATEIHHITDEDVADEPTFKDIASSLNLYFEECDLGGYNIVRYDIPLLKNEFKRAGLDFSTDDRKIMDAQNIFHKMEPRTLSAAMKFFCGEEIENAHSAEADVLATIAVFDAQINRYKDTQLSKNDPSGLKKFPSDINNLHDFCNPRNPRWIDNTGKFTWGDNGEAMVGFGKNKGLPLREISGNNPGFLSWMLKMDFPDDSKRIAKDALSGRFPKKK